MPHVSRASVERIVRCPFSVAHDYATEFFREAEASGMEVRVPLRDFIPSLPGNLHRPVKLVFAHHPDETEDGRVHDALMVEWAAGARPLPDFHGTIRLRIATVDTTSVTLEGAWRPPFGLPGRVFDTVVGSRIAKSTMRELLERLSQALERREETFRHEGRTADSSGISA